LLGGGILELGRREVWLAVKASCCAMGWTLLTVVELEALDECGVDQGGGHGRDLFSEPQPMMVQSASWLHV